MKLSFSIGFTPLPQGTLCASIAFVKVNREFTIRPSGQQGQGLRLVVTQKGARAKEYFVRDWITRLREKKGQEKTDYTKTFSYTKKIVLAKGSISGQLSTGDAASTALCCGALQALPIVTMTPDFSSVPKLTLSGIFTLSLGQATAIAAIAALDYSKGWWQHARKWTREKNSN